jgi:primary-amine oxidase
MRYIVILLVLAATVAATLFLFPQSEMKMLALLDGVRTSAPAFMSAMANPAAPNVTSVAAPLNATEALHRRLTEEGERASRAMPPSPPPAIPPNNGIVQIPIDTTKTVLNLKGQSGQPNASVAQSVAGVSSRRRPPDTPPCFSAPGMRVASLIKVFPEVTWHVCVEDVGVKGLWVGLVDVKLTPSSPWMRVIYQAGLADIFVPYHDNSLRWYDMRWSGWLDQVTAQDAGPNGSLITLSNETVPTVVAEVRDRGVAWLCKQTTAATRRGQEFVVWGVSDGGNYDNIVQYSFRDDGVISFRMGNTGYNDPTMPAEAHSHNALWRVDIDLNGGANNTAYWMTHSEPDPNNSSFWNAQDFMTPFGTENARQWDYSQYSSLLIEDAATNAFGHHIGYEFVPAELGMSRHYGVTFGAPEVWTHNDVYVTVYHDNEFGWLNGWATSNGFNFSTSSPPPGSFKWSSPDNYLLTYLTNAEPVTNADLVVWIKSSVHHEPSDEDRSSNDLNSGSPGTITGVTLAHWSGFDMMPHDLFDDNPLGGPVKCGP